MNRPHEGLEQRLQGFPLQQQGLSVLHVLLLGERICAVGLKYRSPTLQHFYATLLLLL